YSIYQHEHIDGEFNSITGPDGELELQPIHYKLGHAKKPVLWAVCSEPLLGLGSGRSAAQGFTLIGRRNIACSLGRSRTDHLSLSAALLITSVSRSHLWATSLQTRKPNR